MRRMVANAAPWSYALKEAYLADFPEDSLWEVYGSTELGVNTVLAPADQRRKRGSCGRPAPGVEVKLLDESGAEVTRPHVPGELFVRSRTVFDTYYNAHEKYEADRRGEYSLYQGQALHENYLRGVQFTDGDGRARFTTLYPPCYDGRYPHIHFEVYAASPSATNRLRTSQLAMPAEESRAVYAAAEGYGRSGSNFAPMRTATDGVFRRHTPAQLAAITPRLQGDPRQGFSGTLTLAL